MDNEEEICGGCALERLCHASGRSAGGGGGDACDPGLRRKASWLMFWLPLLILACGLFLLVGLLKWDELASFLIIAGALAVYYTTLKIKLNK